MSQNLIINCICMTCGERNDHSTDNGLCKCGADDWLEYRDVISRNEWFWETQKRSGMEWREFMVAFLDNEYKKFRLEPK